MATKACPVCHGNGTIRKQNEFATVNIGGSSTVICPTCQGAGFLEFADYRTEHQSYADPRRRY